MTNTVGFQEGSKMNVITIEKNIPIPDVRQSIDAYRYLFLNKMEIGDSFVINGSTPDYNPKGVRSYIYGKHTRKNNSVKYTIRTTAGHHSKPTSIRIWRIQ